jgi:eukaryotic-like serine/threonine-protein kinase
VYRRGAGSKLALTWFDQKGSQIDTFGEAGELANPAISPDGTRVALALGPAGSRDLWIVDVSRGTNTRFTFDAADDDAPVWSPDSKTIVFSSNRTGQRLLYVKPADGSGEERPVADASGFPTSWSNDGRFILFTKGSADTGNDIWMLRDPSATGAESKPMSVLTTRFNELHAQLSPDGRWIAYASNESSTIDVYVRPFSPEGSGEAAGGPKWVVSKGLGLAPRWSVDGKQLFYVSPTSLDLMAVDIDTTKGFQVGTPRRLFTAPPPVLPVGWARSPDGKRFLFVTTPNGGRPAPFTVVVNWAASLKK